LKLVTNESSQKTQELLPQIVERIFAICKSDPNFTLKDELEIIENRGQSTQQKIDRQNELLTQSAELKKDLIHRLEVLDSQNERKQIELLESIGSEL